MEVINKQYLQQNNESFMDWKIRLLVNKIDKIYDIDWIEIKDLLKLECSSDHLRKTAYGIYEIYKYYLENKTNNISDEEILNELELIKIEIEKERKKKQTINVEYNKLLREEARKELIFEEIRKSISNVIPPKFNVLPIQKNETGAVLSFGDFHYGKMFKSLTNEYSEEIAQDRLNQILSETIYFCKRENISKLYITNVGDSLDGLIHLNQLKTLQTGLIDSVIKFARMMVEFLNVLSTYVNIVYFHVPSSNHTEIRLFNSKAGEFPGEDLEKILLYYIHDMLSNNERIEVPIFKHDFIEFELCGFNFIAKHGHNLKSINNAIKDANAFYRKLYDYYITAHLHHGAIVTLHEGSTNNCEILLTPSVMGGDPYADKLMVGSLPGATFYIFEKNKGKTITYNIVLK